MSAEAPIDYSENYVARISDVLGCTAGPDVIIRTRSRREMRLGAVYDIEGDALKNLFPITVVKQPEGHHHRHHNARYGNMGNWFYFIAGDWEHCEWEFVKNEHLPAMIIVISALVSCFSLFHVALDMTLALSATSIMCGLLYNCLPFDLLRDGWEVRGIPVGKFDNRIALVLGLVGGAFMAFKAHCKTPLDPSKWQLICLAVFLWVCYVAVADKDARILFVGLFAIFAQFVFLCQAVASHTVAIGLGFWFGGFLYNLIPRDIIPSPTILPIVEIDVGKWDDYIFGYFPVVVGLLTLVITIVAGNSWYLQFDD